MPKFELGYDPANLAKYSSSTKPPFKCKHPGCKFQHNKYAGIAMHYQRRHGVNKGSPYHKSERFKAGFASPTAKLPAITSRGTPRQRWPKGMQPTEEPATALVTVTEASNHTRRINKNGKPRKKWGSNRHTKVQMVDATTQQQRPVTACYCWQCGADLRGVNIALTHLKK
jgi:hypothetical protein